MARRILDASGNEVVVTFEPETEGKWKVKQMAWMDIGNYWSFASRAMESLEKKIERFVRERYEVEASEVYSELEYVAMPDSIDAALAFMVNKRILLKWCNENGKITFLARARDKSASAAPGVELQPPQAESARQVFELTKAMLGAENRAIRLESEEKSKIKEAQDLLAAAQVLELEAGKSRKEELKLKRQITDLVKKEAR